MHKVGKDLYWILCGDYVKIGRTSNFKKRFRTMQVNNPYPLELIELIEDAGHLEHELHEKFKEFHHRGEWFLKEVLNAK